MKITKHMVYELDDRDLAKACRLIWQEIEPMDLPVTEWELAFLRDLPQAHADRGLSWKQRRKARELVLKISEILTERQIVLGVSLGSDPGLH